MFHIFKEEKMAWDAWYYAAVLCACIPARVVFSQITQFFSAQRKMSPAVVCSVFGMIANLIAGSVSTTPPASHRTTATGPTAPPFYRDRGPVISQTQRA
jgi:hypothetical protein